MNSPIVSKTFAFLRVIVVAIFAISPALASGDTVSWSQYTPIDPVLPFPEDPFFGADDEERSISDYRGTPVILNLWATWCSPCVREMPALNELRANLKDDGIEVIALSQDRGSPLKVKKYLKDHNLTNLETWIDERGRIMHKLGVNALPTTIFIDAEGNEIGRVRGVAEWDSAEIAAFIRVLFSKRAEGSG